MTPRDASGATPAAFTPLQTAARAARLAVVEARLAAGAPVDDPRPQSCTALWLVCQSDANAARRIAVAARLLQAGASPRRGCDQEHSTALHMAAWRGPIEMVELLLRQGAKEWQPDREGKIALDYARRGKAADQQAIIELLDRPVIRDPIFKQAVAAIHNGDLPALRSLLSAHPHLARDRAIEPDCYPPSYFTNPQLLWFVANNPTLTEKMPANIVEVARAILDAGAKPADVNYTLELVMTSLPARQKNLQRPLIKLLSSYGASAMAAAIRAALGHGELDAVSALLEGGAPMTAEIAAATGRTGELAELLRSGGSEEIHAAFSLAVVNRQVESARLCLDAGADPDAFLIVHQHSTPAHQAAVNDDVPMLKLLSEHGAKMATRDTLWNGTPLGWAIRTGKPAARAYLESIDAP